MTQYMRKSANDIWQKRRHPLPAYAGGLLPLNGLVVVLVDAHAELLRSGEVSNDRVPIHSLSANRERIVTYLTSCSPTVHGAGLNALWEWGMFVFLRESC